MNPTLWNAFRVMQNHPTTRLPPEEGSWTGPTRAARTSSATLGTSCCTVKAAASISPAYCVLPVWYPRQGSPPSFPTGSRRTTCTAACTISRWEVHSETPAQTRSVTGETTRTPARTERVRLPDKHQTQASVSNARRSRQTQWIQRGGPSTASSRACPRTTKWDSPASRRLCLRVGQERSP